MKAEMCVLAVLVLCARGSMVCGQQDAAAGRVSKASELIEQAHKHDRAYNTGPEADQKKALECYQAAMNANPSPGERLHSLFRMAQLHSTSYQPDEGERPDYRKAISLYKQIVAEYPADDPFVLRAMMAISDYHTVLQEYGEAARWSQRVLQTDTRKLEQRLEATEIALESPDQECPLEPEELARFSQEYGGLKRARKTIALCKQAAVDQVAYTMAQVNPLWAQAELKRLIELYDGTPVAERAQMRLDESMDRVYAEYLPDVNEPESADTLGLEAGPALVSGPSSRAGEPHARVEARGATEDGAGRQPDPTASDIPSQVEGHTEKAPRAPPVWGRALDVIIVMMALAAFGVPLLVMIRKRRPS